MKHLFFLLAAVILFASCDHERKFRLSYEHNDILYLEKAELPELSLHRDIYVPAYSDIYYETETKKTYLTVILSLRNTSFSDTLFFDRIEYYDSNGHLLREYIDQVLVLRPMESMEYIVEAKEKKGGAGANFIVSYSARSNLKNPPLIESVMMGNLDNYRFSFTSRGVEIKE
jgi:hypothetical protein